MESLNISLQIFWKNSALPAMKKSLSSEITYGHGQNHNVFLAGIIISEYYKFAKMSTR